MRLVTSPTRRDFLRTSLALAAGSAAWAALPAAAWSADDAKSLQLAGNKSSWPSYRNGFDLLGVSHSKLAAKPELRWKIEADEMVVSTAAIADGKVYIGSLKGELFCLDLKTGKRLWTYATVEKVNPNTFAPGFKASPTVTTDAIYIGDEEGTLHAVNRADGKKLWTFVTGAEIVSSVSLFRDKILVGSHDNCLYCLTADGKQAWKFETQGPVNCTPAIIGERTFVTGCDEHMRVINIETGKEESQMPLGTYLIASPAVMGSHLYVGTYASEVVALDWQTQKTLWTYKQSDREFPYHASAAVTDKYVLVGGRDKRLHCMLRETGKPVWMFDTRGKVDSSPVVVDDRVFFGSQDGNLYAANIETGKEVWKFTDGKSFSASPAIGEGCLVIGSESSEGRIYCFA